MWGKVHSCRRMKTNIASLCKRKNTFWIRWNSTWQIWNETSSKINIRVLNKIVEWAEKYFYSKIETCFEFFGIFFFLVYPSNKLHYDFSATKLSKLHLKPARRGPRRRNSVESPTCSPYSSPKVCSLLWSAQ